MNTIIYLNNILFVFQGQLLYMAIGDPPAPEYFQLNQDSGVITVKKDLMQDYAPYYVVSIT